MTVDPSKGKMDYRWRAHGVMSDSFVIQAIASDIVSTQMVFHRPLGITPLAADEWVCSPTGDIPLLLMRLEDPYAKDRAVKVQAALYAAVVTKLKETLSIDYKDGVIIIGGTPRPTLLKTARDAAKAASSVDQPGSPPAYLRFIPKRDRLTEITLLAYLRNEEWKEAAERSVPLTNYTTCGGQYGERKQVAISYLKGRDKNAAYDAVVVRLMRTIQGIEPEALSAEEAPGEDDIHPTAVSPTFTPQGKGDENTTQELEEPEEYDEKEAHLLASLYSAPVEDKVKVTSPKETPPPKPREEEFKGSSSTTSTTTTKTTSTTSTTTSKPGAKASPPSSTSSSNRKNSKKKETEKHGSG